MAQSKQALRSRIKSVNSTRKITKAMEMIANAKLFRMRNKMENNRVYAKKLQEVVSDIVGSDANIENTLLEAKDNPRKMTIVFCSDLGLCGAYNQNVLKKVKETLSKDDPLYLVGTSLYQMLQEEGFSFMNEGPVQTDDMTIRKLNEIVDMGVKMYLKNEIGGLQIVYTRFINTMTFEADIDMLLPFTLKQNTTEEKHPYVETLFEPDANTILDNLIPMMISNVTYSDWMETSVSEQGSRRMAMKTATDNADELSEELLLEYNKARQAAITQEITEIVGGSSAV